ncbi:MAG: hypothetical protein OEP95_01380 [Myxococcales bacterium]|nr:hypothetical protein [Myxococcales bacterium]
MGTAEEMDVFFPRTVTLELAESHLRGMRISLNTPVVATEELAVGPARAGLLVHLEPDGRPNVTIGIRSLRSGEVVLYSFEGDLRAHSSLDVGIDAGLSFAESMGFLFDEDELGDGDAGAIRRCMGLWNELMGTSGAGNFVDGALPPDAASEPLRELDDLSADDLEIPGLPAPDAVAVPMEGSGAYIPQFEGDLGGSELDVAGALDPDDVGVDLGVSARSFAFAEGAPEPAQPAIADDPGTPLAEPALALDLGVEAVELGPAEPVAELEPTPGALEGVSGDPVAEAPRLGLSKFRVAGPQDPVRERAAAEPDTEEDSGRTKLARVRLVRRGGDGSRRPHPIIRLLGAF